MKLRWRKNKLAASPTYGSTLDVDVELDESLDELDEPGVPEAPPTPGGPVLLTLTTRAEIEKAAERAANPQPVRRRMERGMFGGAAPGHGGGGACGSGGCG